MHTCSDTARLLQICTGVSPSGTGLSASLKSGPAGRNFTLLGFIPAAEQAPLPVVSIGTAMLGQPNIE
jgi:hypothetical protein